MMDKIEQSIVLYMPAYNCAKHVEQLMNELPVELLPRMKVLVVDNCSSDGTAEKFIKWVNEHQTGLAIDIIRPTENLGYAGSQKLAYSILASREIAGNVKKVIMLHADGQYPPVFINELARYFDSDFSVVYGYRSKSVYGPKEETPLLTYAFIKLLSAVESLITGIRRKEWHSGFVMYDISFLKKIRFETLTDSPHIDGHLQFIAGKLKLPVKAIPIFKRYKDFEAFSGTARINYVLRVLYLMASFRYTWKKSILEADESPEIFSDYQVLFQSN